MSGIIFDEEIHHLGGHLETVFSGAGSFLLYRRKLLYVSLRSTRTRGACHPPI
ncbi:MAG: hypothetical protein OFPII_39770 [Osedax symbiont Rs1]|nr:MAG: hypothetical protein OFPII_39770 [Osedax symbiont Rs1]